MNCKLFFIFGLLLTLLASSAGFAYRNVALTEEGQAYRMVEKLIAFKLVDKVIVGNKPWSRRELTRLIKEAQGNIGRLEENGESAIQVRLLLNNLSAQFQPEIEHASPNGLHPFSELSFEYFFLDSPQRSIPMNVGTGDAIDAVVNPLVSYRRGRRYEDTHNVGFAARHFLDWTDHLAIAGRSHFLFRQRQGDQDYMRWGFDELYLRGEVKNLGVQIGRDVLALGPAREGGVFHSTNATPLDSFKIANVSPFYYPWIFKYLGPAQATFYFSVLPERADHNHPYIAGWKLSVQPHRNFEIGVTHAVMSGGEGAPGASVGTRVADAFGVFAAFISKDPNISNRIGGWDMTFRIPALRGLTLYHEVLLEDTLALQHAKLMFVDEAIHQVGFFLPRFNNRGTQSLRFEFQHSGFRPYRHHQYASGWTNNRRLLGNELGPDAVGAFIAWELEPTRHFYHKQTLSYEVRDSDLYRFNPTADSVTKTADNPSEKRFRWMGVVEWSHHPQRKWHLSFGLERVQQFNFQPGRNANNALVNVGLTVYPKI